MHFTFNVVPPTSLYGETVRRANTHEFLIEHSCRFNIDRYIRGEQHADSDIDLLFEFETARKTFDTFMGLCFFLEDVLQCQVELVTLESLSPYIGPHILEEVEYAPTYS